MEKESGSSNGSDDPIPGAVVSDGDTAVKDRTPEELNSSEPVEEDYQYVTGIKLGTVIGCVTLVAFLILLDQSIIATVRNSIETRQTVIDTPQAIPVITSDFHSLPDVGWYGSAYLLARCVDQPCQIMFRS